MRPAPPRWEAAFGRRAPLEVDLGCGRGDYALARAAQRPELDLVALDSRRSWIVEVRRKAGERGLNNLRAIRCDVSQDLPLLFLPGSVAAFTLFHPDPWWKKRHRKRRLVRPEFVAELARLLVPDGRVYLQTDVPDLAEEMRAAFESGGLFARHTEGDLREHGEGLPPSRRERRCRDLGIPLIRLLFRKIRAGGPAT